MTVKNHKIPENFKKSQKNLKKNSTFFVSLRFFLTKKVGEGRGTSFPSFTLLKFQTLRRQISVFIFRLYNLLA